MANNRGVKHIRQAKLVGKNHSTERWWQGTGAHLRSKRTRLDETTNDTSSNGGTYKKPIIPKHPLHANQIQRSLIQKSAVATTPNT